MPTRTRKTVDPTAKLNQLENAAITPYAQSFDRTHQIHLLLRINRNATETPGAAEVAIAGRVLIKKLGGKVCTLTIEDMTGELPVELRRGMIGEKQFDQLKLFANGDVLGVRGHVYRNRSGEVCLLGDRATLLSKAVATVPTREQWRKGRRPSKPPRALEVLMEPTIRDRVGLRMRVISHLRRWLDARGYFELETPTLLPIGKPPKRLLSTHAGALEQTFVLRNSSILKLAGLVAGGYEQVFEIGRCFRDATVDQINVPEYTLLSAACAYYDHFALSEQIQKLLLKLIKAICKGRTVETGAGDVLEFSSEWPTKRLTAAIKDATGLDTDAHRDTKALVAAAKTAGCTNLGSVAGMSRGLVLKQIFETMVVPTLIQPTIITAFPVEVSPLARAIPDQPELTQRAVLYAGTHALADIVSLIIDPREMKARLELVRKHPPTGTATALLVDKEYRRILHYGMPPTAAMWVAIERLVMLLSASEDINAIQLYPYS